MSAEWVLIVIQLAGKQPSDPAPQKTFSTYEQCVQYVENYKNKGAKAICLPQKVAKEHFTKQQLEKAR